MNIKAAFDLDDILAILPHRPPFLFVDRVIKLVPNKEIIAERFLRSDETYFAGHFPNKPIMPGVLIIDALAQTSGLLLGLSQKVENRDLTSVSLTSDASKSPTGDDASKSPTGDGDIAGQQIFFLSSSNMKFVNPSFPGETLTLIAWFDRGFGSLFGYSVEAHVNRKLIAKGSLTLARIHGTP